jgi:hypothetical protein
VLFAQPPSGSARHAGPVRKSGGKKDSMTIRSRIAGVLAAGAVAAALSVVGGGVANADTGLCALQTNTGNYVEAAGGGGRTSEVMYTDSRGIGPFNKFKLSPVGGPSGSRVIQTSNGRYVTAVASGGLSGADTPDVLHTDATRVGSWEKFVMVPQVDGSLAIRVADGHYLTARLGGGQQTYVFNTNATQVGSWEKFRLVCNV